MSFCLIIRKRAENHIAEAFAWYEEQRVGLGNEFVDENKIVVIAVFHLSRNPKLWKK